MEEQRSTLGRLLRALAVVAVLFCFAALAPHLPRPAVYIAALLLFGVFCPIWYFRFCRKCWREFRNGVGEAGGWSRHVEPPSPRTCEMCGAVVGGSARQCPACGDKLPLDESTRRVPIGVLLTGIVLMILIPTLFLAGLSVVLYLLGT